MYDFWNLQIEEKKKKLCYRKKRKNGLSDNNINDRIQSSNSRLNDRRVKDSNL